MHRSAGGVEVAIGRPEPHEYAALFDTTGWNDLYGCDLEELTEALDGAWRAALACSEGSVVGVARLLSDGVLYALMVDVIVHPDWRGRGIGRRLVEALVEECERQGIRDVLLFSARGTEAFYHRCGFTTRPGDAPGMMRRLVGA